ncbi:MAG: T9SS type A sorting domain-containing protein [bacterium]|nr:T9SS type A sorting domain-containing protein [bacterium]
MRAAVIFVIALTAAANCAFADNVISWVRVHTPTMLEYRALTSDMSLDIATAKTGEYVELIIHEDELSALAADGYAYEYLMYDVHDPANYAGKGYSNYTNYGEMEGRLDAIVSGYPNIVKRTNEGTGRQGTHNTYLIKISDNVNVDEPEEDKLLVTGVHHTREPMSLEVPLYFLEQLCADYATDPDVQDIVDGLELYVIPLLCPEGYNYDDVENDRNMWRKNGYDWPDPYQPDDWGGGQGTGVDINRNYSYEWGNGTPWYSSLYCGVSALSEPEPQVVADLATDVGFVSAISFHAHGQLILRPWAYTHDDPPPDDLAVFDAIGNGYKDVIYDETGILYTYKGWADMYTARGVFTDYMYGEHGCYSYCIELHTSFYPDDSQIPETVSSHYEALKWWCLYVLGGMTDIDDENGNPNAPTTFALEPAYPNPAHGEVTFSFALPEASEVTLDVYDVKGRKVMNVLDETVGRGENEVSADVGVLSSGVYIYRLSAGENSAAKKMLVK